MRNEQQSVPWVVQATCAVVLEPPFFGHGRSLGQSLVRTGLSRCACCERASGGEPADVLDSHLFSNRTKWDLLPTTANGAVPGPHILVAVRARLQASLRKAVVQHGSGIRLSQRANGAVCLCLEVVVRAQASLRKFWTVIGFFASATPLGILLGVVLSSVSVAKQDRMGSAAHEGGWGFARASPFG